MDTPGMTTRTWIRSGARSLSEDGSEIRLERVPVPPMPPELISLFDRAELEKYLTEEDLSGLTPKESTR